MPVYLIKVWEDMKRLGAGGLPNNNLEETHALRTKKRNYKIQIFPNIWALPPLSHYGSNFMKNI